jgi:hypothetical protein
MLLVLVVALVGLHIVSPRTRAIGYSLAGFSLVVLWLGVKLTYG